MNRVGIAGQWMAAAMVIAALGLGVPMARGDRNYYVRGDGSGSDSYAGTNWATAWATLQKALSSVPYQNTTFIHVQATNFSGASRDTGYMTGGANDMAMIWKGGYVDIDSAPVQSGRTRIVGAGTAPGIQLIRSGHGDTNAVTVERFVITNVTHGINVDISSGTDDGDTFVRVFDSELFARNSGVRLNYPKDYYTQGGAGGYARFHLTNVTIRAGLAGAGSGSGVYCGGIYSGSSVGATAGNVSTITSAGGSGIRLFGTSSDATYTVSVSDTVIHDCSSEGIYGINYWVYTSGINNFTAIQLSMENCTMANNASNGVRLVTTRSGSRAAVTNSIFAGNGLSGLNLGDSGYSNFAAYEGYNCFFDDDIVVNGAVQAVAGTDATTDPLFETGTDRPYPYFTISSTFSPAYRSGSDGSNRGAYQQVPGGRPDVVNTGGATNVLSNSAWLNGLLVSTGSAPTSVGLYWGESDGGIIPGNWQHSVDCGVRTQGEALTSQVIGLIPETTYYYRFFAQNYRGEAWATPSASFRTAAGGTAEFAYRMKITFSGYDRDEPLTNFPALVVFSNSLNEFYYTQMVSETAGDLRFYDATAETVLNYEIENWDTNAASHVWVQVPELTNNCFIWAYWGSLQSTNPPACTTNGATWIANYGLVSHNGGGEDSTTYNNNGTGSGVTVGAVTGLAGPATSFDGGADHYVSIPDSPSLRPDTGTWSVWFKTDGTWGTDGGSSADAATLLTKMDTSGSLHGIRVFLHHASNLLIHPGCVDASAIDDAGEVTLLRPLVTYTDNAWHMMTVNWDGRSAGSEFRLYMDGQLATNAALAYSWVWSTNPMRLGDTQDTWWEEYKGLVDEVRVSSVARSSNWIWACWLNMASNSYFNTYTTTEPLLRVRTLPVTDVGLTNATFNGQVVNAGGAENPDVYFCWGTNDWGIASTGDWEHVELAGNSWGRFETFDLTPVNLESNTLYYCRAYASNSTGTAWSTCVESFRTLAPPVVSNRAATGISKLGATLNGYLVGGPADVTFYWGLADGTNDAASWANTNTVSGATAGWVSTNVSLLANGTYYYRCFASNAYGFGWADSTTNFVTPLPEAKLYADAVTLFEFLPSTLTVTARLDVASAQDTTVYMAFTGTAVTGLDYTVSATSIVVNAGSLAGTSSLTVVNDSDVESSETVIVTASVASGAVLGLPRSVTATIISDDPALTNRAASAITDQTATLNGTLTHGYTGLVSVFWGTTDGATDPGAWANTNNLGVLSEGVFSSAVSNLWGNQRYYYRCYVTNSGGEAWAPATTNFITLAPYVSIVDAPYITEGDSGTTDMVFTVTLSTPSGTNLWVPYITSNNSALAEGDYLTGTGALLFSPGDTNLPLVVTINGDTEDEMPYEDLYCHLYSSTNGTLVRTRAYGRIVDDDLITSGWLHKMKITFSGYDRDETLTNFPALVAFNTNLAGFAYQLYSTNGYDLRFLDADETAVLVHEIERWEVNGDSHVWVRVPELTNNCHIWAYWGSPTITAPPVYTTNGETWSEGFVGVWHLHQTNAAGLVADSTANRWNGTLTGSTNAAGIVANGRGFNGSSDRINCDATGTLNGGNAVTLEAWGNHPAALSTLQNLCRKDAVCLIRGGDAAGKARFYVNNGAWIPTPTSSTSINDGNWHYVAGTYGDTWLRLYVNGALEASAQNGGTATLNTSANPIMIGSASSTGSEMWQGLIDEVRVSDVNRSSNWVWACWMNMASNGTFNTYDPAVAVVTAPAIRNETVSDVLVQWATFNGTLVSTGTSETVVHVYWGTLDGGTNFGDWQNTNVFAASEGALPESYSTNIATLIGDYTYFYRYYATNSAGGGWAPVSTSFTTLTDLSRYPYKMKISFSGYDREETLTNFPALVNLHEGLTNFSYSQFASGVGYDLRFADATETFILNLEIERWDTTGVSHVWTRVPELTNNCHIWAYWGNPSATSAPVYAAQGGVWDTHFTGVWHMDQTNARDSTVNGHHGTAQGLATSVSAGRVANANDFVADTGYVAVPAHSDFTLSGDYTVAAWIQSDALGDTYEAFMGNYNNGTAGFIFSLRNSAINELSIWAGGTWNYSGTAIPDGEWKYVAYSRQGTTGRFFVDGVNVLSNAGATAVTVGGEFELGGVGAAWAVNRFDGRMDESRVSAYCRSTNWIWAEYMNMASNAVFNVHEPAQCVISNRPAIWSTEASGVDVNEATLNGLLVSTGGLETAVHVYWGTIDGGADPGGWENTNVFGVHAGGVPLGYSTNVTGLLSDCQYFYRFHATNSAGGFWSPIAATFATGPDMSLFPYKMKVTFPGYNRDETLTNFPALVALSGSIPNFYFNQFTSTNGYDLRFQDADENVLLNYEIERWDTNGTSHVWVQVPEFTNNCYIWAYWGGTNATFPRHYTTNGSTWTGGFDGVWHFHDTNSQGQLPDSTVNRRHGTNTESVAFSGVAGNARNFDGDNDRVLVGGVGVSGSTDRTLSGWARANATTMTGYLGVFGLLGQTEAAGRYFDVEVNTANQYVLHLHSTAPVFAALDTNWHYMAATYSGGTMRLWRDGALVSSQAATLASPNTYQFVMGERLVNANNFNGKLDEIRLSTLARSTNWLWAEFVNMSSNSAFVSCIAHTPMMSVLGNGATIANDDLEPSVADHTQFGTVATNGDSVTRTFTITNAGLAELLLSGSPVVLLTGHTSDFTVTAQPATPVGVGAGVTFQVRFQPTTVGTRTGLVSIANNDWFNRPVYQFAIQGYGWGGFDNPVYLDHIGIGATMPMSVDRDGDGLPDYWEIQMFGDAATSSGGSVDTDGDGVSDIREFLAGTHPTNAASYMRMVQLDLASPDSSSLVLRWMGGGSSGSSSYTNAGDRVGRAYSIWAANENATNSKGLLTVVDEGGFATGTNTWTDIGAVGLYARRFYMLSTSFAGSGYTNVEEWAMHRQVRTNNVKYLASVPVDYGSAAANNLNSTLGSQLARGLYANDAEALADKIQWMNAAGGWSEAYLTTTGWYTNSVPIDMSVAPGTAFWVIRGASNANTRVNAVFTGRSITEAMVTADTTFKTNYGGWTAFGWPLARERRHSRTAALAGVTNQLGFVAAGAKGGLSSSPLKPGLLGDQIWVWGNNHWTNYYWLIEGAGATYDGRWWDSHAQTFAEFALQPGDGYYYWHTTNGGATNFMWRPRDP